MKNPIQAFTDAAEALAQSLGGPRDVYIGSLHKRYEANFSPDRDLVQALRAAIPAAKLYAERMGEVVEGLQNLLDAGDDLTVILAKRDPVVLVTERFAEASEAANNLLCELAFPALASLDSAEVGESAGGGATSPDVIREAKRDAWDEALSAVFMARRSDVAPSDFPNPYTPPTATAKETNDDES